MKILLADDNRELRETTRELLEDLGHQVVSAERGDTALEAARETAFDLLVTDLAMPGLDGIALAERFLETAAHHHYPTAVLMISSDEGYPGLDRWLSAERAKFLRKPFSAGTLIEAVGRTAAGRSIPERDETPKAPATPTPRPTPLTPAPIQAADTPPPPTVHLVQAPRRSYRRPRFAAWGLATAAALTLVIAGSASLLVPATPPLPAPPELGTARGTGIELLEPTGPLAALPAAFRWKTSDGAASYRVAVQRVDGSPLWSTSTSSTPLEIPGELLSQIRPAVAYTWTVEALDATGSRIAWSRPIRFRILTPGDKP